MKRFDLIRAFLAPATIGVITWACLAGPCLADTSETADRSIEPDSATAELVIDFGDEFQKRYTKLPVTAEATVWDLMQLAQKHARPLDLRHRGRGATLLVLAIDGQENGGGVDAKNWIYRVNGEIGTRSVGVQKIKAGDTILWRFEKYR